MQYDQAGFIPSMQDCLNIKKSMWQDWHNLLNLFTSSPIALYSGKNALLSQAPQSPVQQAPPQKDQHKPLSTSHL